MPQNQPAIPLIRETKAKLRQDLLQALERARERGALPDFATPGFTLEPPKDKSFGDLATNLALAAAKAAGMPPRDVARAVVDNFAPAPPVARVEIAGPGFLNLYLDQSWRRRAVAEALRLGGEYGRTADLAGRRIQIEFVSANPTGPLNVVNARAGAMGDALANLMQWAGAEVEREYYVNDHGVQVWTLGRSVEVLCRRLRGEEVEFPADGYHGEYVQDLAAEFLAGAPQGFWDKGEEERIEACRDFALARIVAGQKAALESYGVRYDRWFSEHHDLHATGAVERVFADLVRAGRTYEAEGAVWLRTTDYGDDKDRVLRTGDGRTTYLTADIAYHLDKFARGYDTVIDIWGPDHHGHIGRMKAALAAAGADPGRLEILIAQQINLLRAGEPVKMSKRAGDFVSMRELLAEVGNDAARFFFLMRSAESHLDFDLALAVARSNDNPVYYIQYAHARVASILRQAEAQGVPVETASDACPEGFEMNAEELDLADRVALFPEVAAEAAAKREPHRLTSYLLDLAGAFHGFYNRHRVLGGEADQTAARLALARAVRIVIGNGLRLLGVNAPDKM
ncbi:MAG: arginine--tRNA ligase [Patescibacteria group bacterium]